MLATTALLRLLLPLVVLIASAHARAAGAPQDDTAKAVRQAELTLPQMQPNDEQHNQSIIDDMVKLYTLTEAQRLALAKAAEEATAARTAIYRESLIATIKGKNLDSGYWYYEWYARLASPELLPRFLAADAPWDKAVAATLSPAQLASWQQEVQKRQALNESQMLKAIPKFIAQAKPQIREEITSRDKRLSSALKLSEAQIQAMKPGLQTLEKALEDRLVQACTAEAKTPPRGLVDILDAAARERLERGQENFNLAYQPYCEALAQGWQAYIESHLTAEQKKVWQAYLAEADQRLQKAIAEHTKTATETRRETRLPALQARLDAIVVALGFSAEHAAAMRKDLEKALDATLLPWSQTLLETMAQGFESMPDADADERLNRLEVGGYSFRSTEGDEAQCQAEEAFWDALLTSHLSADEQQRWKASEAGRIQFRTQAFTRSVVAAVDSLASLTHSQRTRLAALVEKACAEAATSRQPLQDLLQYGGTQNFRIFLHALPKTDLEALFEPQQLDLIATDMKRTASQWQNLERKLKP